MPFGYRSSSSSESDSDDAPAQTRTRGQYLDVDMRVAMGIVDEVTVYGSLLSDEDRIAISAAAVAKLEKQVLHYACGYSTNGEERIDPEDACGDVENTDYDESYEGQLWKCAAAPTQMINIHHGCSKYHHVYMCSMHTGFIERVDKAVDAHIAEGMARGVVYTIV